MSDQPTGSASVPAPNGTAGGKEDRAASYAVEGAQSAVDAISEKVEGAKEAVSGAAADAAASAKEQVGAVSDAAKKCVCTSSPDTTSAEAASDAAGVAKGQEKGQAFAVAVNHSFS